MTGACKASSQVVNDYLRLFVNRLAYTLQSMRPHPASGRSRTRPPTLRSCRQIFTFEKQQIERHKARLASPEEEVAELRPAIFVETHNLTVENSGADT